MACLTITLLLFSYSYSKCCGGFQETKYYKVNNLNPLSFSKKAEVSTVIIETDDNLPINRAKVNTELLSKTLKFSEKEHINKKNTDDNFHEKLEYEKKSSKREERYVFEIKASVQNISNIAKPSTTNTSTYSQEFLSCGKIAVNSQYYIKFENGTIYIPLYGRYFRKTQYIIDDDEELLICPDFFLEYEDLFNEDELESSRTFQITSLVCSCISTGFIALFIAMFIIDKDLRTLPGACIMCLCVALLVAYTCTFVEYYIEDEMMCMVIGMFMFYFFLASFCWMSVMAYDIQKAIRRSLVELRICTGRSIRRQLSIYSLYAWGTPLAITLASIFIHFTTSDDRFQLKFRLDDCWFERSEALWLYFAGPVLILLVTNFLSFVVIFCMLQKSAKSEIHSNFRGTTDLKSKFILCVKLSSLMGLTWVIGIVAELAGQEWLRYPYVILSALQGMFVFFSYAINTKTKRIARGFFTRKRFSFPSSFLESKSTRI